MPSKYEKDTRDIARENKHKVRDMAAQQSANIGALKNHEQRLYDVEQWIQNHGSQPPAQYPPNGVVLLSFDQMRDAIKTEFGARFSSTFNDLRPFCGEVRDFLAAKYSNVERVNDQQERFGYSAPDEKHTDAFVLWVDGVGVIIDFCRDADAGGALSKKLTWTYATSPGGVRGKNAPWGEDW